MATLDFRYYDDSTTIKIKSGDTLNSNNSTVTIVDQDGNPVDLSGYDSGKILVKNNLADEDASAIISFDSAQGEIVLGNGSFYLVKSADDMKINPGIYKFSFKVKTGTTEITADEGIFHVDPQGVD